VNPNILIRNQLF